MEARSDRIEALIRQLLVELGEDPQREGLVRSPRRVATALSFLTSGYDIDIEALINGACF
ncbi:MAG: GTP cyclohydrolase I, partial [Dehalococcoidia bacterium]